MRAAVQEAVGSLSAAYRGCKGIVTSTHLASCLQNRLGFVPGPPREAGGHGVGSLQRLRRRGALRPCRQVWWQETTATSGPV